MKSISEMAQTIGIVSFQQEHETSIHQHSCLILEANVYFFFIISTSKNVVQEHFSGEKKCQKLNILYLLDLL